MARPKITDKELKDQRVPIMMTPSEVAALDDWMHKNRLRSRGEAIRRLCQVGILVENELEQVVDVGEEIVQGMIGQFTASQEEFRLIVNDDTRDILFGQEEIVEIFSSSAKRYQDALEAVESLHLLVLGLFNAVSPFASSGPLTESTQESRKQVEAVNVELQKGADRRLRRVENRYLQIHVTNASAEDRRTYESLSNDKQEDFLDQAVRRLKAEEQQDPAGFAKKYDHRPFWKESEWITRLKNRSAADD